MALFLLYLYRREVKMRIFYSLIVSTAFFLIIIGKVSSNEITRSVACDHIVEAPQIEIERVH